MHIASARLPLAFGSRVQNPLRGVVFETIQAVVSRIKTMCQSEIPQAESSIFWVVLTIVDVQPDARF
jgi:hypothetical protein